MVHIQQIKMIKRIYAFLLTILIEAQFTTIT